jgi:hypothetical protein
MDLSEIRLNYGFQNSARAALRASLHRRATSERDDVVEVAKFSGITYDKHPRLLSTQ